MKKFLLLATGLIFISAVFVQSATSQNSINLNPLKKPITTSEKFILEPGEMEQTREVEIPDCGLSGFVIKSVVVSPDHQYSGLIYDPGLELWAIRVNLWQRSQSGDYSVPLNLYGNGYETVSATIKNGQVGVDDIAEYPENTGQTIRFLGVKAQILGNSGSGIHVFNVHISGQCKRSYEATVPAYEPLL